MSCGGQTFKHGLSLFIVLFTCLRFLTSSTVCKSKCPDKFQNGRCVRENECSKLICNEGYWGDTCQFGRIRLTKTKGYLTDGSNNYMALSKVMWLIEAEKGKNASIHFKVDELITECNWDHLYIFDGGSIYSPRLAAFSGHIIGEVNSSHAIIPQDIVAKSGKAYVYFYSDGNVQTGGFNISYSIVENCQCSSNGKCNAAGLCSCSSGWTGATCDVKIVNCSNCLNGFCNETLGRCVCNDSFTGEDCSQPVTSSYWAADETPRYRGDVIPARAAHSTAVIGDWMWVYNGYTSISNSDGEDRQHLFRYHLKDKTWQKIAQSESNRWGHTMVAYKDRLIVFGGENKAGVKRDKHVLAIFDTNLSKWVEYPDVKPKPVTGHTATVVGDKMIVIFGLSSDGLFPKVQEYDLVGKEWKVIESETVTGLARYGHTSVYDPSSERIYVYGGHALTDPSVQFPVPLDTLGAYYPDAKKWVSLSASGVKQSLHSAVVLDGMMLVYGGNPYTKPTESVKCHSSSFLAYDFACQEWNTTNLPQLPRRSARYGHTAVVKNRTMYIFGGFNGALFNDVLTYTHGDCSRILNEVQCLDKYFSAGCVWESGQCVNRGNLSVQPQCPSNYSKQCGEFKSCQECTAVVKCGWSGNTCQDKGEATCPPEFNDFCRLYNGCHSCSAAGCLWESNKCTKSDIQRTTVCPKLCTERRESSTCLRNDGVKCVWCESLQRCTDEELYTVSYPYGQCLEWTSKASAAAACSSKSSCEDCHTVPGCGWCEGATKTGVGQCQEGGVSGPNEPRPDCKSWHFIGCPLCQCNGHSNCSANSSVCISCGDKTAGQKCETCSPGYTGDPTNGKECKPCECNGHADTCDPRSGRCDCVMKGALGNHCERCASSQYVGNATNGGSCYYKLVPDYRYTINVSGKTIFNFICSPSKPNKDTVITVEIVNKNDQFPAKLNISFGSDVMDEQFWTSNIELTSKYEENFREDDFDFGSHKFYFKIYVYDLSPTSSISVSVHQPENHEINLLQFFIIFLACFIGLLVLAVIFWKAKSSYDAFRSTRRRNVELVYMTNRPFAPVPICVEKSATIPMKNKPSPLTTEICYGNRAAVATVLVRLPVCAQAESSAPPAALCLGSTLVTYNAQHSSKMVNYMKNVKRRRNPFRTSPS